MATRCVCSHGGGDGRLVREAGEGATRHGHAAELRHRVLHRQWRRFR